jgi:hypothetical protein
MDPNGNRMNVVLNNGSRLFGYWPLVRFDRLSGSCESLLSDPAFPPKLKELPGRGRKATPAAISQQKSRLFIFTPHENLQTGGPSQ